MFSNSEIMGNIFGKDFGVEIEFVSYPKEVLLMEDVERLVIIKNGSDGILAWVNSRKAMCDNVREFRFGGFHFREVCKTCGLGISSKFRFNNEEKSAFADAPDNEKDSIASFIQKSCLERMICAQDNLWKNIFAQCDDMCVTILFVCGSSGQEDILEMD